MSKLLAFVFLAGGFLVLPGALRPVEAQPPRAAPRRADGTGAIHGLVLNAEGQPVARAFVTVERENLTKGLMRFAETDGEGKFVIRGLEPMTYRVYASKEADGYPPPTSTFHTGGGVLIQQVNVVAGQAAPDVVIQLAPKASVLIGRVTNGRNRGRAARAQVTLRRADKPDYYYTTGATPQGTFRVLVPTEPFTVEVSAPGYETARMPPLQLKPGEVRRVEVALQPIK